MCFCCFNCAALGVIACFRQWILADGGESGFHGIAVSGVEVVCIPWNSFNDLNWLQWAQFCQMVLL